MRARTFSAVLAAALALGAAALLIPSLGRAGGDRDHHHGGFSHSWWGPPRDVRAMLAQVSARNLRDDDLKLVSFGTRHTLSSQTDPNRGIGAARDWIKSQFDQDAAMSHGHMTAAIDQFVQPVSPRVPVPTVLSNPYAILHASGPASANRYIVISSHYDSRVTDVLNATDDAPGADDNASAVSVVLELARLFATRQTEANLVFVAFAGEEQGLYGSQHFAQMAADQGWNVEADLNMDIVGATLGGNGVRDRHDIRLFNEGVPTAETRTQTANRQAIGGENDGVSRQLARYIVETGGNDATDMNIALRFRRDRYLRSSDHVSFLQHQWAAVRFTEPNENYDHEHQDVRVENGVQFGDLPQFVDFEYLSRVARVVGSTAAALGRAPAPPVNVRAIAATLTYDTELRWNASPESDVVGYEIVWRDTTEPLWTHSRFIPGATTTDYTLTGINKDDWQVGIRAVDRDGNRSPVAFPVPANS
jgi:Zn-dependent M28 family amino/carboxypeptidase